MHRPDVSTPPAPAARRTVPASRQLWLWLSGLVGSRYDGLHHFAVVEPGVLLRCGQPRVRELAQIRREHGLRAVVCARGGTRHPLRGRWFGKEREYCRQTGIRFEHMPFSDAAAPAVEVFDRFLDIVRDPANRPVLVHCEQGFHRSGILCAAYRIALADWSLAEALDEMRRFGFEPGAPKRRALSNALRAWSQRRTRGGASRVAGS